MLTDTKGIHRWISQLCNTYLLYIVKCTQPETIRPFVKPSWALVSRMDVCLEPLFVIVAPSLRYTLNTSHTDRSLIELVDVHGLDMALPKDVPTRVAWDNGIWTRPGADHVPIDAILELPVHPVGGSLPPMCHLTPAGSARRYLCRSPVIEAVSSFQTLEEQT